MQRRAGAAFVVFFLLVGAASLALVTTASSPEFQVNGQELQAGDSFKAGGQTYNVESIEAKEGGGGGGHGGGGGGETTYTATFNWTNESFQYTESWGNNSTVDLGSKSWVVLTSEGGQKSFVLEEKINRTKILKNDKNAADEMVTYKGEPHVVITKNGSEELVPASEYFPDPKTRTISQGGTLNYKGNQTTVSEVTNESASVQWTAPKTETAEASQKGNVTLGDTTYFAYMESGEKVVLSQDFEKLNQFEEDTSQFHHLENGLWGVTILSGVLVIMLLGMAFMPSRY